MEEKKKPFWKKWAQRIGLALGLTASTLALGTSDAHANEIKVDDKNNVKVADTIDHSVTSEDALSRLEQLIAQNNQALGSKGISDIDKIADAGKQVSDTASGVADLAQSIRNVGKSTQNIGNSSSLNSTINNVKSASNSWDRANEQFNNVNDDFNKTDKVVSQVLSTEKVKVNKIVDNENVKEQEKSGLQKLESFNLNSIDTTAAQPQSKVEQIAYEADNQIVSNEDASQQTLSSDEAIAKEIISRTHFNSIKYNPYDKEDALSSEIVELSQKISEAKYNGNDDLAHFLTLRRDELRQQRIEMTNARIEQGIEPEVLTDTYSYQSRNITPKKLDELTDFARNASEDWTPGEKLAHYSSGLIDLNIAINGYMKNNNPDTMSISERANYYHTLSQLLQVYEVVQEETTALGNEAKEHPDDPAYKLEMPASDNYKGVKSHDSVAIEQENSSSQITSEPVPQVRIKHSKTNVGKWGDDVHVQIYNPEYTKEQQTESVKEVDINEEQKASTSQENKVEQSSENKQTIDESKLADVSVGQMGIFEEEDEKTETKPGEIDLDALLNVSEGQMGIWNEIWDDIEDILDEDTQKQEQQKQSKSKDDDDDFER